MRQDLAEVSITKPHQVEMMCNFSTYHYIGDTFNRLFLRYYKHRTWFYHSKDRDQRKADEAKMRRLILLSVDADAEVGVFLKAQFEIFVPWAKPRGITIRFAQVISDKAPGRYRQYLERVQTQFPKEIDQQWVLHDGLTVSISYSILASAERFAEALLRSEAKNGRPPNPDEAQQLLEILARAGFVSPIYVLHSPVLKLSSECSFFLVKFISGEEKRLAVDELEEAVRVREALTAELSGTGVGVYV